MKIKKTWIIVAGWLLALCLLVIYLSYSLKVVADITQFMPQGREDSGLGILQKELQSSAALTTLLVNIHGGNKSELVRLSRELSESIQSKDTVIRSVDNGQFDLDTSQFDTLKPYKYFLSEQDWSAAGLHSALMDHVKALQAGAGPMLGSSIISDPYMSLQSYLKSIAGDKHPPHYDGIWLHENVGALLAVKVKGDTLDLDKMQAAQRILRENLSELSPEPGVKLEIAGPGVMAVATREAIQKTTTQVSILLGVLLLFVFWFAYRSIVILLYAAAPLLSAIVSGLAITQLIFGQVHGIVIAFGITLLAVCLDYPLHLFSHSRKFESLDSTIIRIWPTLRLGAVSSALAYLVLFGSGFDGLSQLALFAASGLMVALFVTRWILPVLVNQKVINARYFPVNAITHTGTRWLIVVVVLTVPAAGWFTADKYWETNVDAISPVPEAARKMDAKLRNIIGLPEVSHILMLKDTSKESVLQKTEEVTRRMESMGIGKIVDTVLPVTQVLPSVLTQSGRRDKIPSRSTLSKNLEHAVKNTPFRKNAFVPFLDAAEQARVQPVLNDEILRKTPLAHLVDQGLLQTENGWISIIRLSGIASESDLQTWLAQRPEIAKYHIKIKDEVAGLLDSYRNVTLERMVFAFLALILLVYIGVRNSRKTARILLPVGLGVVAALAMPLLTGNGLNVFHLLAAMLVMGMGLDYSLFFNREAVDNLERHQSQHAITISMLTTVATFSVMALSTVPVMMAMGSVIATGILLSFILAWIISE